MASMLCTALCFGVRFVLMESLRSAAGVMRTDCRLRRNKCSARVWSSSITQIRKVDVTGLPSL